MSHVTGHDLPRGELLVMVEPTGKALAVTRNAAEVQFWELHAFRVRIVQQLLHGRRDWVLPNIPLPFAQLLARAELEQALPRFRIAAELVERTIAPNSICAAKRERA